MFRAAMQALWALSWAEEGNLAFKSCLFLYVSIWSSIMGGKLVTNYPISACSWSNWKKKSPQRPWLRVHVRGLPGRSLTAQFPGHPCILHQHETHVRCCREFNSQWLMWNSFIRWLFPQITVCHWMLKSPLRPFSHSGYVCRTSKRELP